MSTSGDDLAQEIYLIADELRAAGTMSRHFAASIYEQERGDQVLQLAARLASLVDTASVEEVKKLFDDEGWARVSPAIGVEAVVMNSAGEMLLCQRRDNQHWCLPGGISEVGEPTTAAALRELWEEAGVRGEVTRLLGLFDGPRWGTRSKVHLVHLVYEVSTDAPEPSPGTEMITTRFFPADALPEPMHQGHDVRVPVCFELIWSGRTHHDAASTLTGEMPMHQRPSD